MRVKENYREEVGRGNGKVTKITLGKKDERRTEMLVLKCDQVKEDESGRAGE